MNACSARRAGPRRELGGERQQRERGERPEQRARRRARCSRAGRSRSGRSRRRRARRRAIASPSEMFAEREERHREGERERGPREGEPERRGCDRQPERPAGRVERERPGDPAGPDRRCEGGRHALARRNRDQLAGRPPSASSTSTWPGTRRRLRGSSRSSAASAAALGRRSGSGCERLRDGVVEPLRQVGAEVLERRRARLDPARRAGRVARAERMLAGERLPEHHPDRPDVGGGRRGLGREPLGRDVGERPRDVADLRSACRTPPSGRARSRAAGRRCRPTRRAGRSTA